MIPDAEFACVACNGRGCEACNDTGVWRVNHCPYDLIDDDTRATMEAVDLARDGLWPVAGGSQDQSAWFADAFRYIGHEMPRDK